MSKRKRHSESARDECQTVGKVSSDLLKKATPVNANEQMRESLTDYDKNIWETVSKGIKELNSDFFLVVITKKERLMPNVMRNYFFFRLSCPTPDYDQVLYRYVKKDSNLEFTWVIPSKDTCIYLKQNALILDPSERGVLDFVLRFSDGSLFKLAKKFNNEQEDSPLLN